MKQKVTHFKSLSTGNTFPFNEYVNHGRGGLHLGYKDLPKEEYPYTFIYEELKIPLWKLNEQLYPC